MIKNDLALTFSLSVIKDLIYMHLRLNKWKKYGKDQTHVIFVCKSSMAKVSV